MSFFTPPSAKPPAWTPVHAFAWAEFLETSAGQALVHVLSYDRPSPGSPTESADSRACRADRLFGYDKCLENLFLLKRPLLNPADSETAQATGFPDLDDDSKWTTN
jgi:hypothetical protein